MASKKKASESLPTGAMIQATVDQLCAAVVGEGREAAAELAKGFMSGTITASMLFLGMFPRYRLEGGMTKEEARGRNRVFSVQLYRAFKSKLYSTEGDRPLTTSSVDWDNKSLPLRESIGRDNTKANEKKAQVVKASKMASAETSVKDALTGKDEKALKAWSADTVLQFTVAWLKAAKPSDAKDVAKGLLAVCNNILAERADSGQHHADKATPKAKAKGKAKAASASIQ